ncbi:MAG: four helix bundle protein [Candidatus Cloacimonetes bacterium]|nr:four helix bundle protein [Candidatus Cloacimonadota bacterium]
MAKSFYELEIWKNGLKLLLDVYKITAQYPKEEKYDLTSQTRRAANSVIANIAEAHGRFFLPIKLGFCINLVVRLRKQEII